MRILVTGGAGYIGSHLARRLRSRGDDVVVFDDLSAGSPDAIPGIDLIEGTVVDRAGVLDALRTSRAQAIVHLAALKSVEESVVQPERYFKVNVSGTLAVLGAAADAGVRTIVYSSSCAVYGTPDRTPVDEAAALHPDNPYGESKLLGERLLPWFERRFGVRFASLRYFNVAGADESGDYGEDWAQATTLIPRALKAALGHGPPVSVFGTDYPTLDGTAIRDFIDVDDLVDAHLAAVDRLAAGEASLTVNLGTGRGNSVREVLDAITALTGQPVPSVDAPRRAGDPPVVWADPSSAATILDWRARHDLSHMIQTAWRWHSRHPQGYVAPPVPVTSP